MKPRMTLAALGVAAVLAAGLYAFEGKAKALKSGPSVGQELAGPFHPINVNGENAGQKHCLYCENGNNPVAMIFAREPSPALAKLIKKIDEATVKNAGAGMGSFVVFCSDEAGLDKKLASLAKENGLRKTVLAIDNPAGPKGYNVAKDADVTVVLYVARTVKVNHAFAKGELKDADIEKILGELPQILSAQK